MRVASRGASSESPDIAPYLQRHVWILLLAIAVLAMAPAFAQDTIVPEPAPLRFRVAIDAPRTYRRMLEDGLDIVRWQKDERVTKPLLERLVAEARKAAAEAMAAEGYFSAVIDSRIEMRSAADAIVHLKVEPGARTRVRDVALDFSGPATKDDEGRKRIEVVRQTWQLRPGEAFRQSEWDEAKEQALARLGRGRYAAAKIAESEARIDPSAHSAELKLRLDSGPVFFAGPTIVSGLKRYPPSIVHNLNPVRQGEPYDAIKLDLYQRRLLETGYFNAVHFAIDPDPDQAAAAPLNVNVLEAPSQRIDTGVGFSTDTGFGVTLDYSNADIFDAAWRLRPRLQVNQKEQHVNVTLDSPPRPGGVWHTYTARAQRRDIEGQESREAVIGWAHNWGLESTPSQVSVSAHVERQAIDGSTTDHNHAVFVGYRRTFRTTDDLVSPRRGLIGTAEAGAAVPGLTSRDFVRIHGKVSWLVPVGRRNDLLLRGEAGAVLADTRVGVVSSFLFRTGGDQSIRGYAFESIGVPQGNATVGGRYLALGSVEFTRWVTDSLGGAVFVDAGDAFDEPGAFELAVGLGIGLRWRSPIGPFRADVAYGERSGKIRPHFSVGYSF